MIGRMTAVVPHAVREIVTPRVASPTSEKKSHSQRRRPRSKKVREITNAVIPVITYSGPLLAYVLTGSFIVENIFAIPGLGKHFVTSIYNRDYTVILGLTIFYSIILVGLNMLVDFAYTLVDPRIKLIGKED